MTEFQPKWMSPPGETIKDILNERELSTLWLAEQLSFPSEQIDKLLSGNLSISESTAQSLSKSLGASSEFWLKRDSIFQTSLDHSREKDWFSEDLVKDMIKNGWIEQPKNKGMYREKVLEFFGVTDSLSWINTYQYIRNDYAFRTSLSFESNPVAVSAWLKQAENLAQKVNCNAWDSTGLESSLEEIRKLITKKDPLFFIPLLQKICARNGVALVLLPTVRGSRASGATKFLTKDKAIIAMSARYLSDDHFWFTFFHEVGHLLLHNSKDFTIDFNNSPLDSEHPALEIEANEFAESILIPKDYFNLLNNVNHTAKNVIRLAGKVKVSPGVLVGQMQNKDILARNKLNFLKRRYYWNSGQLHLKQKV